MSRAEVVFRGIRRDTNEGVCTDGEMMRLTNMTATKDGLKVLSAPLEAGVASGSYSHITWFAKGNCYLALDNNNHLFSISAQGGSATAIVSDVDVTGYETVGNMICCFTANGVYYVLHKGTGDGSDEYKKLGYGLPHPTLYVTDIRQKLYSTNSSKTLSGNTAGTAEIAEMQESIVGLWNKAKEMSESEGFLVDRAFYRVGIRLFDGTLVNLSPIVCAEPAMLSYPFMSGIPGSRLESIGENGVTDFNSTTDGYVKSRDCAAAVGLTSDGTSRRYAVGFVGFKPELVVNCGDLSDYKDLVQAIEVYTTGSVSTCFVDSKFTGSQQHAYIHQYSEDRYREKVRNTIFRKCMTLDTALHVTWEAESYTQDMLQVQESLSDSVINSRYRVNVSQVYNSRLHIADCMELLSTRFAPALCSGMMGLVEADGFCKIQKKYRRYNGTGYVDAYSDNYYRVKSLDKAGFLYESDGETLLYYSYFQAWCRFVGTSPIVLYTTNGRFPSEDVIPSSGDGLVVYSNGKYVKLREGDDYSEVCNVVVVRRDEREASSASELVSDRRTALFVAAGDSYYAISLHTSEGDKIIKKHVGYLPLLEYIANSTVSYPDMRAQNLTVYQYHAGTCYYRAFGLTQKEGSNVAMHFEVLEDYMVVPLPLEGLIPAGGETAEVTISDVLKVSGLDNPLVFPSAQTYQLGAAITGLGTNVNALSDGQHGEDPLYVFTERGVRAMVVDRTGKTVYPAIDDVSGDVMSGGVVPTEDGLVFATDGGVLLMRGKQVVRLSDTLNGEDSEAVEEIYERLEALDGMNELDGLEDKQVHFLHYLRGAVLGYSYRQKLLFVSNAAYSYLYVYNLESGEWSQMNTSVNDFAGCWPRCFGVVVAGGSTTLKDFDKDYSSVDSHLTTNSVLMVSRPLKLGTVNLKKMMSWCVNLYSRTESIDVVLLGSHDGRKYQVCSQKRTTGAVYGYISSPLRLPSYRYYIFVVHGSSCGSDSIVNGLLVDAEELLTQRWR